MLSGACVEREQIIVCAYDRVTYNDLGVGLVASSCGGSRPEQYTYSVATLFFISQIYKYRTSEKFFSCFDT